LWVNGGVVLGRGFESFDFWGANGVRVVHGRGLEYFNFLGSMVCTVVHGLVSSNLWLFGVNGDVVQWCNDPQKDKYSTTTMHYATIRPKSKRFKPTFNNLK
jgi:hypothetical protein